MPTGKITPVSNLIGKIDRGGGTGDHDKLINRDLADQHPIEAITGLLDALNQIDSKILTLDEKIDSEADFVASELNKLRTELNTYKEFVNREFIKTNNKIINLQDRISTVETHLNEAEARLIELSEAIETETEARQAADANLQGQIDDISIEELSKRKVIKVYEEEINDKWVLAETFNPTIVYYEKLIEEEATYYKRIILDEESFIPDTYYYYKETGINTTRLRTSRAVVKEETEKDEGYYPAYEYNENETYYELAYDSNPSISTGIWYFNDDMEVPFYANEKDREAGIPFTMWLWNSGEFYWYEGGAKRTAELFGVMGYNWIASLPTTEGYRYWRSRKPDGSENFGDETAAIGVVFGPRSQGGVGPLGFRSWYSGYFFAGKDLCPHWKDEEMHDELGNNNTVDAFRDLLMALQGSDWDKGTWKGGARKIYISSLSTDTMAFEYISRNAIKLSDELLPYGDDNYKTKYVEVEVTSENFEPGKYYTYYQTPKEVEEITTQRMLLTKTFVDAENYYFVDRYDSISNQPIYKQIILTEQEFYDNYRTDYYKVLIQEDRVEEDDIIRIQLDPKESIYRDYDGNDVLKIVDNNVLINGDPLYPNLTVTSDTYIDKVLENNAEEVYDNELNRLKLTIPETAKHGFCSYISFKPNLSFTFNIVNNSNYNLKIIMNGAKTTLNDLVFSEDCQYNLMFLCNGVNVELYIQEIQLG